MKRFFFFVLVLLLPVYSWAAYKIYLNNGSVISGVNSFEEAGDDVNIYFNTGSMTVPKRDVLKIEGKESPEPAPREMPEVREQQQERPRDMPAPAPAPAPAAPAAPAAPEDNKSSRMDSLRTELNSVDSDIRSSEEEEAKLAATINEKSGAKSRYNLIQLKQLEKEVEPLKQDLSAVQQKKAELIKKRSDIESELKSLQ